MLRPFNPPPSYGILIQAILVGPGVANVESVWSHPQEPVRNLFQAALGQSSAAFTNSNLAYFTLLTNTKTTKSITQITSIDSLQVQTMKLECVYLREGGDEFLRRKPLKKVTLPGKVKLLLL